MVDYVETRLVASIRPVTQTLAGPECANSCSLYERPTRCMILVCYRDTFSVKIVGVMDPRADRTGEDDLMFGLVIY
jgi:hypothetical protein